MRLPSALAVFLLTAAPASTGTVQLSSVPMPLDPVSEILVGIVNSCSVTADFTVTIKNAANGSVLRTRTGTIPAGLGKTVTYNNGGNLNLVVTEIDIACSNETPAKLASVAVRDLFTKVPRLLGNIVELL